MNEKFFFHDKAVLACPAKMANPTVERLWRGFTFTESSITPLPHGDGFCFAIAGDAETARALLLAAPALPAGKEYAVRVTERGACVTGCDYHGMMCGFFHLLMQITADGDDFSIAVGEAFDAFTVKERMIHFCIFHESDLGFIRRMLRFSSVLGYTHIVLEFWGMLRFDVMRELAWPEAFEKAQVAELICELRELGVEPIPMFNHLGHASACRGIAGKHVVLDQNPTLHRLFTPDGWVWRPDSEKVDELHRAIRAELYELFGEGSYFHAGIDEAYCVKADPRLSAMQGDFLRRITNEIAAEGRRPMMWADMLLPAEAGSRHVCTRAVGEAQALIDKLHPSTVLVDWDYDVSTVPVPTFTYAAKYGLKTLGAPWYDPGNIDAYVHTAAQEPSLGVMVTTWHTLCFHTYAVLHAARKMGAPASPVYHSGERFETAAILRKLSFEGPLSFEDAGWARSEILNTTGTIN